MKRLYRNKKIAVLLCLCFVAAFALSFVYIVEHADHDCTGEHCEICYYIHNAQNLLQQMGTALALAAGLSAALLLTLFIAKANVISPRGKTLFALKAQLNN
jgi:hypothetical protein